MKTQKPYNPYMKASMPAAEVEKPPLPSCPKCEEGTITDGPKFTRKNPDGGGLADHHGNEALAWDCTVCGFRGRIEHVKDAK